MTPEYRAGSIIEYRPFGGRIRRVRVIERFEDIKNGRAGFDGQVIGDTEAATPQGSSVWGYDDQITQVVRP